MTKRKDLYGTAKEVAEKVMVLFQQRTAGLKPNVMSMTYGTTEEPAEKVGKADPSATKVASG